MKKLQKILVLVAVLMLVLSVKAFAMSQSELIDYISKARSVNGMSFQLSSANKVKLERFFNENPVTEAQAEQIKSKVDETVSYMESTGATSLSTLTQTQKDTVISKANSAASVVGATISYSSTDKAVTVYDKNGKQVEALSVEDGKLVQTGSSNYQYVVIPAVAIIAIAAVVFYINKRKVNA